MTTLVFIAGLTVETFSPAEQYATSPRNLGRQEIERLIGLGRAAGSGPLPRFIRAAADVAQRDPEGVRLVFIVERAANDDGRGHELIDAVREYARDADVIETPRGTLPWRQIVEIASVPASPDTDRTLDRPSRALITGAHTELGIKSLATALNSPFSIDSVAVCPHLVGSSTREAHLAALR